MTDGERARGFQRVPPPRRETPRKHVGESLAQIVLRDPVWYFFAEQYFASWGLHDHHEIGAKARSIIVEPGMAVLYEGLALGTLYGVRLVAEGMVPADTLDEVRSHLDLSLVMKANGRTRRHAMGAEFTQFYKRHVLGKAAARITERRAEEFFADNANFAAHQKQSIGSMRLRKPHGAWTVP